MYIFVNLTSIIWLGSIAAAQAWQQAATPLLERAPDHFHMILAEASP